MPRSPRNTCLEERILVGLLRSNGASDLYISVTKGDFRTVRTMIQSGADFNSRETDDGKTIIFAATLSGNTRMIGELIRAGANPNVKSDEGVTPLMYAVAVKNVEVLLTLLDNGADLHAKTAELQMTALHSAAECGHVRASKLLIERGSDVNIGDKDGLTALHYAINAGAVQLVRLLVAKGADVSTTCTILNDHKQYFEAEFGSNVTPVFLAVYWGDCEIVDILIKAGADVNVKTSENLTTLHLAAEYGPVEIVNMLLNAGAVCNINTRSNSSGSTPLLYAAKAGQTDIVKALLEVEGVEVNPTSTNKITPLVAAVSNGHLEVVKLFLAKGAPVNDRSFNMMTPLHVALTAKKEDVAAFLIKHNADIHAVDSNNAVPLHAACRKGVSLNIIRTLVEKGANADARSNDNTTPLHYAAKGDHLEIVKFLVDHGADCSASTNDNWTALHYAASNGSKGTVEYLVKKISEVNAMLLSGRTPLHVAVDKGHLKAVKILVMNKANINAQDNEKCTPLHIALEGGHLDVADLLLKRNVLVDLKEGKEGCTPLFLAVQKQYEKLVSLLLDKRADVNATNKFGILPIHLATKAENIEIVKALLAKGAYYNVEVQADGYSGTPLMFAREAGNAKLIIIFELVRKLFCAVSKSNMYEIGLCVQAGTILNARNSSGRTALHSAVSNGNADAVKTLLSGGADITLTTSKADSPLMIAVAKKFIVILEILLAHSKDLKFVEYYAVVNAKSVTNGDSLLHAAVKINEFLYVKLLLTNGAVYNAKNNLGKMPLELLLTDEATQSLLTSAQKLFEAVVKKDGLKEVKQILEKDNSAVNARQAEKGVTPLFLAIFQGHIDITQALLFYGADYCLVLDSGSTPLHIAAAIGNVDIVKMLLEQAKNDGVKKMNRFVNAAKTSGTVALHVASNLEVVLCLLQAGAVYSVRDSEERTAAESIPSVSGRRLLKTIHQMFEDVEKGVRTVMHSLNGLNAEEFKAVTSTQNAQGQTLLQVARANGHIKIVNKLIKKLK